MKDKIRNGIIGFIVVLLIIIGTLYGTGVLSITDLGIGGDGYLLLGNSNSVITNQDCNIEKTTICPGVCYVNEARITCQNDNILQYRILPVLDKTTAERYYGTTGELLSSSNIMIQGSDISPEFNLLKYDIGGSEYLGDVSYIMLKEDLKNINFRTYLNLNYQSIDSDYDDGYFNVYLSKDKILDPITIVWGNKESHNYDSHCYYQAEYLGDGEILFERSDCNEPEDLLILTEWTELSSGKRGDDDEGLIEINPSDLTEGLVYIKYKGKLIGEYDLSGWDEMYLFVQTIEGTISQIKLEDSRIKPLNSCSLGDGEGLTHHTYVAGEEIFWNSEGELSLTGKKLRKFCFDHGMIIQDLDERGSRITVEAYDRISGGDIITVPANQEYTVFFIAETNRVCSIGESLNIETNECQDTFFLANKLTVELEEAERLIAENQALLEQAKAEALLHAEQLDLANLNLESQTEELLSARLTIEQNAIIIANITAKTDDMITQINLLSDNYNQYRDYMTQMILLFKDDEDKLREIASLIDGNDEQLAEIINNAIDLLKDNQVIIEDLDLSATQINDQLALYLDGIISLQDTLDFLGVSNTQLSIILNDYQDGLERYSVLLTAMAENEEQLQSLIDNIDASDKYIEDLNEQIRQDKIKNTILIGGIAIFILIIGGLVFYIIKRK